jgi:hypothetical protein
LEEAAEQCQAAMRATDDKPIFLFYRSAVCFMQSQPKEGLLILESAMEKSPKLLKKFIELNPAILQNNQVVDIVARYKKGRKI